MKKKTIFEDSGLKASEISGDIVKWLVYDGLEDKVVMAHSDDFVTLVFATFVVGAIAAISGTIIKDFGRGIEQEIDKTKKKKTIEINRKNALTMKQSKNGKSVKNGKNDINGKIGVQLLQKINSSKVKVSTNFIPKEVDNNPFIRSVLTRYATAAIEGGVLFASYQITTKIVINCSFSWL